jgi:hypothetical protein
MNHRVARTRARWLIRYDLLMLCVMLGVEAAGFGVMLFGVAGMAVGGVGVVTGLFVIAGFVVLGGFAVMLRRVLVVFGSLGMMLDACVVAHDSLPVIVEVRTVYAAQLTLC